MKRSTWIMVIVTMAVLAAASRGPEIWRLAQAAVENLGPLPAYQLTLTEPDLFALVAAHLAMLLLARRQRTQPATSAIRLPRRAADSEQARRLGLSQDALRLMKASGNGGRRKDFPVRQLSPRRTGRVPAGAGAVTR